MGPRKVSDVEVGDYGDPIPWKNPTSPLILVRHDGSVEYAAKYMDNRRRIVVAAMQDEGALLIAWAGQYSTDVFEVDDLERARMGLGIADPVAQN